MVPPPRNYAADAHECIMGSGRKARRIQGCGAMIGRPRHSSPRDFRLAEPMAAPRAPDIIVRRQPTRETSLVVSRKSPREREGAHAHVRLDEGARLVDERRPLSSRAWERRKIKREMGVISAHRPRPPIVVAGQTLVKAGLRPPPAAASALTRAHPQAPLAAKRSMGRTGRRSLRHEELTSRSRRPRAHPILSLPYPETHGSLVALIRLLLGSLVAFMRRL